MPRIGGDVRVRLRLAQSLAGSSLGDDTVGANSTELTVLQEIAASQKRVEADQSQWFAGDLFWKRVAVIATVMIPVTTAVWKALIARRQRKHAGP